MRLFLQTYYILFFYILYNRVYQFVNFILPLEPDYVFFAKLLSVFKQEIHSVIFLLALFCCLLSIFKPWRSLRVLNSLFILILISIVSSYGKIDYPYHAFVLSSVLVCFFNENKDLNSRPNFFILRLIQGMFLSHYFMSGLWKLREMISVRFEFSLYEIAGTYIAYTLTPGGTNPIVELVLHNPWLLSFGYFCVLIFQLTALIPVFLNQFFKLYGVLALLFHLSTGVSMDVYFVPTVMMVLFFFIIAESMRECRV
ncbi:MAG: hypothetical protein OXN83_05525 [Oligoflexia bacterium]|nr:hypothetical protein [Oligoflexia bacterium]